MACRVVSLGFNHCNASSVVWRALSLRCSTKEDCCCRRILNKSLKTEIKDKETWHVVIHTTNNTSDLRVLFFFVSCTSSWWSTCRPSARSCPHLAPPVAPQSLHPSALLLAHTSVEKRILVKVNKGDHVMRTSQSHLQPTSSLIDHHRPVTEADKINYIFSLYRKFRPFKVFHILLCFRFVVSVV